MRWRKKETRERRSEITSETERQRDRGREREKERERDVVWLKLPQRSSGLIDRHDRRPWSGRRLSRRTQSRRNEPTNERTNERKRRRGKKKERTKKRIECKRTRERERERESVVGKRTNGATVRTRWKAPLPDTGNPRQLELEVSLSR